MAQEIQISSDEESKIIEDIVDGMSAAELLAIPGIYEILSEELNNEIIERWEADHPEAEDEDEALRDESDD